MVRQAGRITGPNGVPSRPDKHPMCPSSPLAKAPARFWPPPATLQALLLEEAFMSGQAAGAAQALAFLRRPKIPMAPRPEPKSTSAAGSGVAAGAFDIWAVK